MCACDQRCVADRRASMRDQRCEAANRRRRKISSVLTSWRLLQDSHVFFVRISMEVQKGSIGLDSVQRTTLQTTLSDRVAVRLFREGGAEGQLVQIQKLFLTVDLLSQSSRHRRPVQFDSSDLEKTVRRCFVDNTLQAKQYILAVSDGARLRLRINGLVTPNTDLAIALCMSQHARLGAPSSLRVLHIAHLRRIADLVFGQGTTSCNFVLTRETEIECRAQPNSPINLRQQVRTMFLDKNSQYAAPHNKSRNEPSYSPSSLQDEGKGSKAQAGWSFAAGPGGSVIVGAEAGSGDDETRLLRGDTVESVNGQSVAGRSAQEVEALAKGPAGNFVTFGVMRGSFRKFITLEREAREPRSPQAVHHPAAPEVPSQPRRQDLPYGLSGSSSPGASDSCDRSIQRGAPPTPPASSLYQTPPSKSPNDQAASVSRRSRTSDLLSGAPDIDDLEWHVRSSPDALVSIIMCMACACASIYANVTRAHTHTGFRISICATCATELAWFVNPACTGTHLVDYVLAAYCLAHARTCTHMTGELISEQ